jgi:hypothetical protein
MNFNKLGMARVGQKVSLSANNEMEEVTLPGLIEPELVTATLKYVDGKRCVVVAGKYFHEQQIGTSCSIESNCKIADFEVNLDVPVNAKDATPKITLITSKDECGQINDGLLRVQWEVADVNVPIEIKDCLQS